MRKSINAKKMQSEFERICGMYPNCDGIVMTHDEKNVLVTVFTEKGMSEYRYGEEYLEGEVNGKM